MRIFRTPRYRNVPELLDSAGEATPEDLHETLRDIRRANIFGLGTWVILRHLKALLKDVPQDRPVLVLDLATGSADIPEELCRWARREGRDIKVVATDFSEAILQVAKGRIKRAGFGDKVSFVVCDAARPSFGAGEFDVVTCSLAFHHFTVSQARLALGEMARLSRIGFIVNDVYRSQGAWYMARFLTLATTTNRLTRHDGPASVYRAFTRREYRRLSKEAGVPVTIYSHPFWRVAVVGRKGATP